MKLLINKKLFIYVLLFMFFYSCQNYGYNKNIIRNADITYGSVDKDNKVFSVKYALSEPQIINKKYLLVRGRTNKFDIILNSGTDSLCFNQIEQRKKPFNIPQVIPDEKFNFQLFYIDSIILHDIEIRFMDSRSKKFASVKDVLIVNENEFNALFKRYKEFKETDLSLIKITTNNNIIDVDTEGWVEVVNHINGKNNIDYEGTCTVKVRGNTSKLFRKKGFKLELTDSIKRNTSLLNMPKENDWVLHGPYKDISLIRNKFAYDLYGDLGYYSARTEFCELILNNEYLGIYVLTEKIKKDKNRLNINSDMNSEDSIGSFIVKIDKGHKVIFSSNFKTKIDSGWGVTYQSVYPKFKTLDATKKQSIKKHITAFEQALLKSDSSYLEHIHVNTFVDYFILHELTRNIDSYRLSTFIYKNSGDKLCMGPVWDFNFSLGLTKHRNGYSTEGWVYKDDAIPFWWNNLLARDEFKKLVAKRWNQLRNSVLSNENIIARIDDLVMEIPEDARNRNFKRWDVYGTTLWDRHEEVDSYDEEIESIKKWLQKRLDWMDRNIEYAR